MFGFSRARAPVATSDEICESSVHSDSTEGVIDLKGNKIQDTALLSMSLDYKDLWALALTTSIGGHYLAWSLGLSAGFGTFMAATVVIASAFICMLNCLAELASAIPFAGGAYGIARVTLGIYPGYLVACADTFKSIVTVANVAINVGRMMTAATTESMHYEPIYWLIFYAGCIAVNAYGGKAQWRIIRALAAASVLLLLMFLLGSAKFGDLPRYGALEAETNSPYEQWFHGGMYEFMHVLPRAAMFFTGIQNINLASREVQNPKTEVPKAYMMGLSTGLLTSFATVLVACSLSPGVSYLKTRLHPLSTGYMLIFNIQRPHSYMISLPATIASGLGFMYFFGQKLRSMGESRMMNPFFAGELPGRHTPINGLLIGSVLGLALCVIEYFIPAVGTHLYNISVMCAFFTYMAILVSFVAFRAWFPTITREFRSPLGYAGAFYGMAVFSLAIIGVCGFQKDQVALYTFLGLVVIATVYYFWVVEKRQVFSEEEKTVMFKAYLLKGNKSKAHRMKKGGGKGTGRSGGGAHTPTPRSDHGKKEVSVTVVYKAAPTEAPTDTTSTPVVAYLSDEEQPPLARRGGADEEEQPTCHLAGDNVAGGEVTLWEEDHDDMEKDGDVHDVLELPV